MTGLCLGGVNDAPQTDRFVRLQLVAENQDVRRSFDPQADPPEETITALFTD